LAKNTQIEIKTAGAVGILILVIFVALKEILNEHVLNFRDALNQWGFFQSVLNRSLTIGDTWVIVIIICVGLIVIIYWLGERK
jgi:hypothetical protein